MCPICEATMQRVNSDNRPAAWWCPRCGTLKYDRGVPDYESPRFIKDIVRQLQHTTDDHTRTDPGPLSGPLWGKVSHLFYVGCTSATFICRALGFDPEKK